MRRHALAVGVMAAILALGVWLVQPKPVAVAMFYVRAEPSIFESAPYTELTPEDVARCRKLLIKSLTSPVVLSAAVRGHLQAARPADADPDALLAWLHDRLQVRVVDDNFIELSLPADRGADAVALLKSVVDVFVVEILETTRNEHQTQLGELQKETDREYAQLKVRRAALSDLRTRVGATDEQIGALNAALAARRVELAEQEARLERLRSDKSPEAGTKAGALDEEVQHLRAVVVRLEKDRRAAEHPWQERQMLEEKIRRLESRVAHFEEQCDAHKLRLDNAPALARIYQPATMQDRSTLRPLARKVLGL